MRNIPVYFCCSPMSDDTWYILPNGLIIIKVLIFIQFQAPSSLLDALEQHLASLEGKKIKDSTAASRYISLFRANNREYHFWERCFWIQLKFQVTSLYLDLTIYKTYLMIMSTSMSCCQELSGLIHVNSWNSS